MQSWTLFLFLPRYLLIQAAARPFSDLKKSCWSHPEGSCSSPNITTDQNDHLRAPCPPVSHAHGFKSLNYSQYYAVIIKTYIILDGYTLPEGHIHFTDFSLFSCLFFFRDSSNESGATDAVSLSMSMSEIEDPEIKGKKKRGRPGKQQLVCIYSKKKRKNSLEV